MPHSFPVPDEKRLEQLIAGAYAALPEPDMARLTRIEERLSRKLKIRKRPARVNKLPWWIVLLLGGGFAAAAWWAGEQWFSEPEAIPVVNPIKPSDDREGIGLEPQAADIKSKPEEQTEEQTTDQDKRSPMIYQRENF